MPLQTDLFDDTPMFGIMMPALQHRWRLTTSIGDDHFIYTNVISADFDFAQKTMEVIIEQPRDVGGLMRKIGLLNNAPMTFENLDGNVNVGSFFVVSGKLVSHKFRLDYASSDSCKHILKFEDINIDNEGGIHQ